MIETTITKIQYDADGVQRRWSIPFPYADVKHISIYTKVGDEPMVKVVDNYDIDEDDSVVIYPTVASGQEPLASGTKIIISRETPETQLEDASQVHFTSKDVERGLDKLTMITQELSTTAGETMEVSADAFAAAEEAVNTANEANATAGEAKTLAEQAMSVANDANATATAANTKSDTAIKTANDANEKSTAAVSTANTAKTVAGEANSTANNANTTATEAKEISAAANTTANNADKTANEADKKADNAVIVANNAKSVAEGIDAKATQALDNSNTAVNTANSAKQTAEGVNDKATQALANSTTALETATEAKNTADSYQGQITTIESKIPSAASETNQLADKQFVQDLTSALNFVQWVDSLPATGESKYIYAVPREETDTDGKQIAALYLWDGSAWRGAGAFSLNIDPATLATKVDLAGYLPLSGGTINGELKVVGPKSTIITYSGDKTSGYTYLQLKSEDSNQSLIRLTNIFGETLVRQSGKYTEIKNSTYKKSLTISSTLTFDNNKVLDASDKAVANGVASLDANAKVPSEQIPTATTSTLGGVKPDGNTITVTEDGVISATGGSGSGFDFEGTKAEFDAAVAAGTITDDSVSLITDDVSGDNVATKAELQDKVSKAGDTMTGMLKMSGNNQVRFGTDDYFYYVNKEAGSQYLTLYHKNGKGLLINGDQNGIPYYYDGTNYFRLLTTADLNTNIRALNWSAMISWNANSVAPSQGMAVFGGGGSDQNVYLKFQPAGSSKVYDIFCGYNNDAGLSGTFLLNPGDKAWTSNGCAGYFVPFA